MIILVFMAISYLAASRAVLCCAMRRFSFAAILLAAATSSALLAMVPAQASDLRQWRNPARLYVLPFPRSDRAQAVWESDACWNGCGAQCSWGQNACLRVDAQSHCVAWTDACDRTCLKTCRTSGGPLLDITD